MTDLKKRDPEPAQRAAEALLRRLDRLNDPIEEVRKDLNDLGADPDGAAAMQKRLEQEAERLRT